MTGSNPLLAALFVSVTLGACAGDGTDSSRLDSRDETLDSFDSDTTPPEDEDTSTPWESQPPFHIERAPEGEPLTADEIDETTDAVATMWRDTRYFQWLLDTSHGMATGNEWGYPDYKAWWQDTIAVKSGDTVTFRHVGGGDNNLLRHARVLLYALAGHLATGDTRLKEIAIQYMRGVQAMFTAMVWQAEDPPTPIIIYFHVAALAMALAEGEDDMAEALAAGLERRVDTYMDEQETRVTVGTWDGDATTFLIASASYGFPLTDREARFVSDQLRRASEHYRAYPRWDLWDDSVADGEYDYIPGDWVAGEVVDGQTNTFQPAEIAALLEYCESPYKDPLSSPFVDCEALLDARGW